MENENGLRTIKIHFILKVGEEEKEYITLVNVRENLIASADSFILENY